MQAASAAVPAGKAGVDGIALFNKGKYVEAAAVLNAALKANPKDPKAASYWYYLGCCYYQARQNSQAVEVFRYIRNAFPQGVEARLAGEMLSRLEASASPAPVAAAAAPSEAKSPASADEDEQPEDEDVRKAAQEVAELAMGKRQGNISESAVNALRKAATKANEARPGDLGTLPDDGKFYFQRNQSGHMVVNAELNGRPITCMFDTGAGAHFGKNQLTAAGVDFTKAKPCGYTYGWAGVPIPIWRLEMDVKLGNMTRKIPITIEDDMTLLPLLGQDFVRGFQYEIDDKGGVVNLHKSFASNQKQDSLYDVPCTRKGRDDVVDLTVNGRKTEAFIDTGAFATIIHPSIAQRLGIQVPDDAEIVYGSGVGGDTRMRAVYVDLRLGPIHKPEFRVLIGGHAGTCIGQDFMEGWRVKVDRERNLLRFFH